MRTILPQFLHINEGWETLVLHSYQDKDQKWHAGFGTGPEMAARLGITLDANTVLTEAQAEELHKRSINEFFAPELEKHLIKAGIETNDYQFNALLDVYYNRGARRLLGSYTWHWLQQKGEKWFMEYACEALVNSKVDGFIPLNEAYDKYLGHDRVYLGLTLRRIDDASLFQTK